VIAPRALLCSLFAIPFLAPAGASEPAPTATPVAGAPSPESGNAAPPKVAAGAGGFTLSSADGDFALRLRSLVQTDSRTYDGEGPETDGFLVRRARLELAGTVYGEFDFRVMPDFAGAGTTLLDAWLRWNVSPAFQVQVGKVKLPIGLEREQSREHNLFNEFGYPTSLVPNRDAGVNVQGKLASGALAYYLGAFDGTADGASVITDVDGDREAAGRLFATPFAARDTAGKHLGFGVAGTWGSRAGAPAAYRTIGQQTFFRWRDGVVNDGTAWRVVPQLYYYRGPAGVLAEYALSSQELASGAHVGELEASAWTVNGAWVLTGEKLTFGGLTPARPIDGEPGDIGAWQLVARATELAVDEAAFPLFADPTRAARRARTLGIGVSWYLNRILRFSADYNDTDLDGGPLEDERVFIARAQLRF
jgi:phosphate-selective porin OprO/OprP